MQLLQWQSKGAKNCTNCSIRRQYHLEGCGGPSSEERRNDDSLYSVDHKRNYSQLLASSTMSQKFIQTFEYQHTSSVSDLATKVLRSSHRHQVECYTGNAKFFDGCPTSGAAGPTNALISDVDNALDVCCGNDICSSSKSNLKSNSASSKIDTDDSGGCSSSGALVAEKFSEGISGRDACMSILKSGGVLDRDWTSHERGENTGVISGNYGSKPCKVCEHLDSTLNLLLCDNCEDAFHTSCCNPRVTRIPVGEWLCNSCLKQKKLKEKSTSSDGGSCGYLAEYELGTIEFMLRDPEPYMSNVRIGDKFQANVPKWSGPKNEYSNLIGYPLEMDPSKNFGMQEQNPTDPLKLSSVGNWLQCQEIIEGRGGDNEIICGKWRRLIGADGAGLMIAITAFIFLIIDKITRRKPARHLNRAPLFEVQTDEFECFSCIRWDPAHADCAVPQELDTKEVLKQLKYIEKLKPRLSAKRRKLENSKGVGSRELSQLLKKEKKKPTKIWSPH